MAENDQQENRTFGEQDLDHILDSGRTWDLAPILEAGGALIFGDGDIDLCGAQTAAAIQACLASGKKRVIALGPLRPISPGLAQMRRRVAAGESPFQQAGWGVQGPRFPSGPDWQQETSLASFLLLWEHAVGGDPAGAPELVVGYPFLANTTPAILPGMAQLRELAKGSAVIAAMSPYRSKTGRDAPSVVARNITDGLRILASGDLAAYERHSSEVGSDGIDVGQALRYLIGPWQARIVDTVLAQMPGSGIQTAALVALTPAPEPEQAPG